MTMTRESIVQLLMTNDRAVARALVALTDRQTMHEKSMEVTVERNDRGFRPCHARRGTSMAKFFLDRGFLTQRQIAYWRVPQRDGKPRITIYATQLLEIAKEKAATKVAA